MLCSTLFAWLLWFGSEGYKDRKDFQIKILIFVEVWIDVADGFGDGKKIERFCIR